MESLDRLQGVTSSFVNETSILNNDTQEEINHLKQELAGKSKKALKQKNSVGHLMETKLKKTQGKLANQSKILEQIVR
jgi:hypothetical protein